MLPESEKNTDEMHENINSEDESDSINEITAKILDESADKAIEAFRKVSESNISGDLTEKDIAELDKKCEIIKNRKVITRDLQSEPKEIISKDDQIITGPPTLTRFEKARIMGARALQLSLGAPVFIEIPKNATTSLEIAMEELKQKMIPIIIKRTLPNDNYQNIPIEKFQ